MAETPFTTQAKVENYLQRSLTAQEAALLNDLIAAAKIYIESYTGHVYGSDSAAAVSSKYYSGNDRSSLDIDEAREISAINYVNTDGTDGTVLDPTQYVAHPLNETVKNHIIKRDRRWICGEKNIKVTAKWGSTDVPANISTAATLLVAGYMDTTKDLKKESIEGYSREFAEATSDKSEVLELLDANKSIML